MKLTHRILMPLLPVIPLFFVNCGLLDEIVTTEEPTYEKMQGIWEVTEATNEYGDDILDKINFPKTIFQLGSNNSLTSTAGPMATYLVYGANKYTSVASKIDQVFDYTKLEPDDGEWFIENGVVSRFTMYFKLETVPGVSSVQDLLSLFGIYTPLLRQIIYHKFIDVNVTLESDDVMVWEFDEDTKTKYYTVNGKGEEVPISISTDNFSHCTFKLEKRVKDLKDIIKETNN